MKVIESIRDNRTGEVNEAVMWVENDNSDEPAATALVLVGQVLAGRNMKTRRNLFTTVAIRVEL